MQNMPGHQIIRCISNIWFRYIFSFVFESVKEIFPKYMSPYIMHGTPPTCHMLVKDAPHTQCMRHTRSITIFALMCLCYWLITLIQLPRSCRDITYSEIFLSFQHFVCEAVMKFIFTICPWASLLLVLAQLSYLPSGQVVDVGKYLSVLK